MAESDLSSVSGAVDLENLEIWWKISIGADYKRILNIFGRKHEGRFWTPWDRGWPHSFLQHSAAQTLISTDWGKICVFNKNSWSLPCVTKDKESRTATFMFNSRDVSLLLIGGMAALDAGRDFWITSCDFIPLKIFWWILEKEKGVETLPRKLFLPVPLQWCGVVFQWNEVRGKWKCSANDSSTEGKFCQVLWVWLKCWIHWSVWRWIINCCIKEMMWTLENASLESPAGKVQLLCVLVTLFSRSWGWLMGRVALGGISSALTWVSAAGSSRQFLCGFSLSASAETCGCQGNQSINTRNLYPNRRQRSPGTLFQ